MFILQSLCVFYDFYAQNSLQLQIDGQAWKRFCVKCLFVKISLELNQLQLLEGDLGRGQNCKTLGGTPGLVVMGGDSCSKGCEFESRHCILDGHFSHMYLL